MQKVEIAKCKYDNEQQHYSAADTVDSIESIYGQRIPRMRLLKVNYVNPNFDFNKTDCQQRMLAPNPNIKNPSAHRCSVYKKLKCPKNTKPFNSQRGNIENINSSHTTKQNCGNCTIDKCVTRKSVRKTPCDTWNVKIAMSSNFSEPYVSGIISRSDRIEQIEKLNEQMNIKKSEKIGSTKPPAEIAKIDKIFEQAKKDIKNQDRSSADKKVKKLAHELQFKCQCKGSSATNKPSQTPNFCGDHCGQLEAKKSKCNLIETDERINKKIQKLFEPRCENNNRLAQSKQPHRQNRPDQVAVEPKKCTKRSSSTSNRCQVERIHLRKTTRRRQPLLISNHAETNIGLFSQPDQIANEKSDQKNLKTTCGYKNCTLLNCPITSVLPNSPGDKDTTVKLTNVTDNKASYNLSEKKDNIINSKKLENEVKVVATGFKSEDVTGISLQSQSDKTNDLNDVQNLSGKNLTKATTDKVLLSSALNNTVNKNAKTKSGVDVNLKNNENRKFNDLKSANNVQHKLKIFVKNSSVSNHSLESSTDSEKDDGYYDQAALCDESCTDIGPTSSASTQDIFSTKLGCDGAIFWNNCYFYDDNYCASCDLNQENRAVKRSDYICFCSPEKPDVHDIRPRSMDGGLDSGVSISGDTGSSPDSDIASHHLQSQADLEARRLKRGHVLTELLETERIYVSEMNSILKGYRDQMVSEEKAHLVPPSLQGKEDILFGNLHELYTFHSDVFLKDLENCISTTELVALCFVQRRDTFYRLYSFYCQNIPRSERLRESLVDAHLFLQECQKRLGHKLPLAAYLLKPVQRITKYQLLLKDLLRFSDSGTCTKELQKALDCMLIVLKCVNDSMHQIAITGFPADLSQQGELLLQDSFQVWTESKKDIRLRLKTQHRHIFLYQKAMLFCKPASKTGHNKSTYQYKHYLKMSQIGLTESVRGDPKRFEVWLQGRQEVHTLQAPTIDIKNKWVAEVKRVLLNQLEELKGEKIKQYGLNHRPLRQTVSWDTPVSALSTPQRAMSYDTSEVSRNSNGSDECAPQTAGISSSSSEKDNQDVGGWSSDYSNSEDELSIIEDNSTPGSRFIALADYCAVGHSEVSMKEGDTVELLKVGCAGWWFVKVLDANAEGWTPAAYLEPTNRKSSRSSSRNQDRIN